MQVLALARPVDAPRDRDLGKVERKKPILVIDGQRDFRHTHRLAPRRPGENHILRPRRPQIRRLLLAQTPCQRVQQVRFFRPVRPHNRGHAGVEVDRRLIGEGLEAVERQSFEAHGNYGDCSGRVFACQRTRGSGAVRWYNIIIMPALDRYHENVATALRKDGWTITHNPMRLTLGDRTLVIDLGAERLIAAEKDLRKIAVEVKTFGGPSAIADLQQAVGQYMMYEDALAEIEPERELFLAVPEYAIETIFSEEIGKLMLRKHLRLVFAFSVVREEIVQWIP